jgi:hypothetical protein
MKQTPREAAYDRRRIALTLAREARAAVAVNDTPANRADLRISLDRLAKAEANLCHTA